MTSTSEGGKSVVTFIELIYRAQFLLEERLSSFVALSAKRNDNWFAAFITVVVFREKNRSSTLCKLTVTKDISNDRGSQLSRFASCILRTWKVLHYKSRLCQIAISSGGHSISSFSRSGKGRRERNIMTDAFTGAIGVPVRHSARL